MCESLLGIIKWFNLDSLKLICRHLNISSSGRKEALLERVAAALRVGKFSKWRTRWRA